MSAHLESLATDVHLAWRRLRRAPAFAAIAILTMAAGIAANVAVFSILRAVVLDPLPFDAPDHLVRVHTHPRSDRAAVLEISHPTFRDLRAANSVFTTLAAFPTAPLRRVWQTDGNVETVKTASVSGDYFALLGMQPHLGRTIGPADDVPGAAPVAVLSWATWQTRLGADARVLGRVVELDGRPYTIVGVMPRAFADPTAAEVWTALVPEVGPFAEDRAVGFLSVLGRLSAGTSIDAATAETDRILAELNSLHGPPGHHTVARLEPLSDALFGSARATLLLLSAAAALVLLLTSANLANVLLARGVTRRPELALRAALGAGRTRIVRELLMEALLLGIGAGGLATWIVSAGLSNLTGLLPVDLYRAGDVRIDANIVFFSLCISVVGALVFGLGSALLVTRSGAPLAAGRATQGRETRRAGRALMGTQVALATVVLVASGLIGRSFIALRNVDTGFHAPHLLSFELFLPDEEDAAAVARVHDQLLAQLRALPGVESAASVLLRPLEGPDGFNYPFTIEGVAATEQNAYPFLNYEAITPGYFETLGIPLHSGRTFADADAADTEPVVIVSNAVARRFFPDGAAVGSRIRWGANGGVGPWLTIVGVVGEARYRGLTDVSLDVYVPHRQTPWALRHVVLRTSGDPAALSNALAREVAAVQPGAYPIHTATFEQLERTALVRPRFHATLFGLFGIAALLLAAVGTYGVVAHFTSRRVREMGIRLALGARRYQLGALVVADALRTCLFGLVAGLVAAAIIAGALDALLYSVPRFDVVTFGAVTILLAGITLLAAVVPARRAVHTDPAIVLRQE
jgi:predicted permease